MVILNPIPLLKHLVPAYVVMLLLSPLSAYVEDRELEYILDQHVEAMGGRGAIQEIKTVSMRGVTTSKSGEDRRIFLVRKLPNKIRLNLDSNNVELVVGYDGSNVWYYYDRQGNITAPEDRVSEFESIRRDSPFWLPITQFEKAEYKITRLPDETIDEAKCYVFQVEIPDLGTERYFVDQSTLLAKKREVDEINDDGSVEKTTTLYNDYEATGGVQFPMSMETIGEDGASVIIKFDSVKINKGIFDSYFRKP
ncbi:LolA family protein [Rubellicoccus peritrichatus]|uniref:Outer membrane lipoprotein-sorting protein n=1 Tax=Rubellicoccus peritrichatus TaxID=3080537 RepID=A0AAQ3QTF4_9BACT|nr:outer membrane lipoprotein-sorting protein [Puniceicoccus sp. CR14]WOO41281.1 outer membrane lipoprotein-sorting protein [Puniceicoccus sp. CR14]